MGKLIDISGEIFGRLTVVKRSTIKNSKEVLWECRCICGGVRITRAADLKNGKTSSCGCKNREVLINRNSTHGMSNTRIYEIWLSMVKRCSNPKTQYYYLYGGRGIKVCERWLKFVNFYEDMKDGYADNLTLDRHPNINGNYGPDNCRWATSKQQANNKRGNHLIAFNGKTMTLAEWSDEFNIAYRVLENRLRKGWDIERALMLPIQKPGGDRTKIKGKHLWDLPQRTLASM